MSAILTLLLITSVHATCGGQLDHLFDAARARPDLRHAFIGPTTMLNSNVGPLELGVVDVEVPGVSDAISKLLIRSISDARESNRPPGHLPDHLVDDVIRQYISPEKVRTLWSAHGFRFAVMNEAGEIVASVLLGADHRVILYVSRWANNVPTEEHPGLKPAGYHHLMNLSVKHELRRARLGTLMMDAIIQNYRSLFNGCGIWMRADPPWHDKLAGLGFTHDPSMDSFLPAESERTLGLPHGEYNAMYACACRAPYPEKAAALAARGAEFARNKIQYFSFTRDFAPTERLAERSRALWEKLTLRSGEFDVLIIGAGPVGTTLALQLRAQYPAARVLVVEKGLSAFAMAGHGSLYPLTLPGDFEFPGGVAQPAAQLGRYYPGGVEAALLANQENLDVLLHTTVNSVSADGEVRLSNGVKVHARRVVIATGAGEPNHEILDPTARRFLDAGTRVQDFPTFARDRLVARHVTANPAHRETVAVVGGGAAARATVRLISNDRRQFAPAVWFHGDELARRIEYEAVTDHFLIHTDRRVLPVDRVVLTLGFRNQTRELAASLLAAPIESWADVVSAVGGRPLARHARASTNVDLYTIGAAQFWDGGQKSLAEMFADVVEFTRGLKLEDQTPTTESK